MHLEVLGRTMIILDSYRAAVDLLDKRGSIYSDRPKFALYELLGWNPGLTFLQYGKQFNKQRQMHQSYLTRHKAEDFKPMQTQEARMLVRNLIESTTDKYDPFLSRFATGIITQIVAGHQILSNDDPYLRMSHMVFEAMSKRDLQEVAPSTFFQYVRPGPLPPWFPGAHHITLQDLYDYPLSTVKKQQEIGEALPSFIPHNWNKAKEDEDLKGAAAIMFGAGESTAKAQKEIDSVVGDLRLPDFEDRKHLPFVECILQETLRWNPGVPLGVPHCVMQDDVYRGMFIPKGSLGMSLDETRFLPKPAGNGEPYFNNVAFGFGRRICTGQHVAENSLWIAIASILASCKISNAVDENGNIIVPESGLTDGLVSHPKDTRCVISPRSSGARELVLETAM
ncbi:cytochrome P450 [Mycena leptocephala]|nr:cytochrome P450 [Mycena leptocephala]